jgi:tRNA(Ile)-lysidine synthase
VARFIAWSALSTVSGGQPVAFRHVETLLELARGGGPAVDLPGCHATRVGTDVVLCAAPARQQKNFFRYPLSIPGEVADREAGWVVSAEVAPSAPAILSSGATALVQLDRFGEADGRPPLAIRSRRPGDRFQPLGLNGRKKLQDYFVDRKVARRRRDGVPLVVDEQDRIVWVAGHTIGHEFRVTDPAQAVLILRLTQA